MTYSKILNIDRHYPSMEENKETATYRGKECCLREARHHIPLTWAVIDLLLA